MLEVKNLVAGYGDISVLHGLNLSISEKTVVALVGANGAGKTTLLRAISGLVQPQEGAIVFEGESISGLAPHEIVSRGICHVPEGRQLFTQMTVRENLMLGAFPASARNRMKSSLEWVYTIFPRLKERDSQNAGTLSGGEQQMVAIGRGLMMHPKLLILDEPTLGLAPKIVAHMFDVIDEIRAEDVTIFIVEQNLVQTLKHSSSAFVIEAGRIVSYGQSADLLADSKTRTAYLGLTAINH